MDVLTPQQRKLNMSRIKGRDTRPEMLVRRALHAQGFRFRLHDRNLPGRPDLVFPKFHAVLFVHGCFWHGHDCPLFKWPATRRDFWSEKIRKNHERDKNALRVLREKGWRVLIIWECALKGPERMPVQTLIEECTKFLRSSRTSIASLQPRRRGLRGIAARKGHKKNVH